MQTFRESFLDSETVLAFCETQPANSPKFTASVPKNFAEKKSVASTRQAFMLLPRVRGEAHQIFQLLTAVMRKTCLDMMRRLPKSVKDKPLGWFSDWW